MFQRPEPEVRNLEFDIGPDVPRHWHSGRRSVTSFYNNLSVFFPPGERFFMASVKQHRQFATDPKLAAQVRAFLAQEGIHSREHVRYNTMLREQGYPIQAMEGRIERLLARVTRRNPARIQLAITVALEHFTALMADLLLNDPRVLEGAHPAMAALWRWHAAEENEHKAVAFDLFKQAGGTYPERAFAMIGATVVFWAKVIEHQVRLMATDDIVFSGAEWRALFRYLFVEPGGLQRLLPPYWAFFRRDFHPWQHDNSALLDAWKRGLEQAPVGYKRVA